MQLIQKQYVIKVHKIQGRIQKLFEWGVEFLKRVLEFFFLKNHRKLKKVPKILKTLPIEYVSDKISNPTHILIILNYKFILFIYFFGKLNIFIKNIIKKINRLI